MHIGQVISNQNEILWINDWMSFVMKQSRKHKSFGVNAKILLSKSSRCGRCGQKEHVLEVHHITPVWVMAVEFILRNQPVTIDDLKFAVSECQYKSFDFSKWHELSNLKPLCLDCHPIEQMETDRKFKLELCEKYRLVYSYRVFDSFSVTSRSRMSQADESRHLSDYISRQILDLRSELAK